MATNRAVRARMATGCTSSCACLPGCDAGEAGDDRYALTGAGTVNLYDNQGYNSIVRGTADSLEGASLTLDADGTGHVVGFANGCSLNVQNGLFGTAGTVQDGNGAEVDLEVWEKIEWRRAA